MLTESLKACEEIDKVITGKALVYELILSEGGECKLKPQFVRKEKPKTVEVER